jgi:hypothetical protein
LENLIHLEDEFKRFQAWVVQGCQSRADRKKMGTLESRAKRMGGGGIDVSSQKLHVQTYAVQGMPKEVVCMQSDCDCMPAAYENACIQVSGVRPNGKVMSRRRSKVSRAPSSGPGRVTCNVLHDWIKADRIIYLGHRITITNQSASYQALPNGAVYFCEAVTRDHTKHAFVVDTRNAHTHILLDGACDKPLEYRSETMLWVLQWSRVLQVHTHKLLRRR